MELRRFPAVEAAGRALAERVAGLCAEAVAERGQAVIAVPGGRSPLPFFADLFARDLPWERITVVPGDDRCVAVESPDSNEGLVRRFMAGRPATLLSLHGLDAARLPVLFDAVVLGLGDDGHVASLFPGQPLDGAPIIPGIAPVEPRRRVSLSLGRLLATRALFLLFGGAHRLSLLDKSGLPVSEVLARSPVPVQVFHYD